MLTRVEQYIASESLLSPRARVLVGLSGGADSVALLVVLRQLHYDCVAAHCNFRLRGEESERDRDYAHSLANSLGVPFVETAFDTVGYAEANGISIEMAARELRYSWFESVRMEQHCEAIAVAHHRDDNAETVLLNLTRGTGILGLTGMQPRNGHIIRPLLCVSRQEIVDYLSSQQIDYVTDSTNLESLYTRNKLRLDVIPLLRTINPSFDASMERTIAHLRDSEKFYRTAINEWRERVCTEREGTLHIDLDILHTSPAPATLLFEIVSPMGFNASQIDAMSAANLSSGRQFLTATHRAVSHRTNLIITPLDEADGSDILATWSEADITTQCGLKFAYHASDEFAMVRDAAVACIDADKLRYPLILRRWRKGDTFIPFGMRGRKKVSDYFSDKKYSLLDKEQAMILCDSEKIVWVVGERLSEEVRIDAHTRRILVVDATRK